MNLSNNNNKSEFFNHITKLDSNIWEINKSYNKNMNVSGKLFLSEELLNKVDYDSFKQITNVASLPGIIGSSIAMPDVHVGYGFTIGGVAAFDSNNGVFVPGGVGFDINCGVRLIKTNLTVDDFLKKRKEIINQLYLLIPSGLGKESNFKISMNQFEDSLYEGANWAIKEGYGTKKDLNFCEEKGCMNNANTKFISKKAYSRGKNQFGTLGSGNHFLEIQFIDKIYDKNIGNVFGLFEKQICIMIHCGSRGFGHQICSEYLQNFTEFMNKENISITDPELVYAPINSTNGSNYFDSMACGANYAWSNRQIITYNIRSVFENIYNTSFESLEMDVLYDVSHNIIKKEKHIIENQNKYVYVHRKGSTRSFPSFHPDLPLEYKSVGQPVLIPGSMGTSSYILCGSNNSMNLTFGSACHGSGRIIGRSEAIKSIDSNEVIKKLLENNIMIKSSNLNTISSEAPEVYKSSSSVVNIIEQLNIAKKIAKLNPLGVIKN